MDVDDILKRYFHGEALELIVRHGKAVCCLSLEIAVKLDLDAESLLFVEQAAMLHDVGVCRVSAPEIGQYGLHPYIMHGLLGREILEAEGLPLHALVCERHIGVGLSLDDIIAGKLPLPHRDMSPQSVEEEIVCFADLFYSKKPGKLEQRKSLERVRGKLAKFGQDKVQIFDRWVVRFGQE